MEAVLVFPHHIFKHHSCLKKDRSILLIEDSRFFSEFSFHKQKLVFHRACLKNFELFLKKIGYKTYYIEKELESIIKKMKISSLYVMELDDFDLQKKLDFLVAKLGVCLTVVENSGFITNLKDFQELFIEKKHFRFETFYIHQRKKLNLLLEENGKPIGGKWNFDLENRNKLPKFIKIPDPFKSPQTSIVKDAIDYVEKKYPHNPGSSETFNYPTTHAGAKQSLDNFLKYRLQLFGDYEDAIIQKENILFHSCLSPLLNVGLLTPNQIIEETIKYSKKQFVPLNSLEGFIRQIIGWREFVRGVYHNIGEKQRKENFFSHNRKMPQSFYEGTTGILPVDETIKKLKESSYLHHIERLMVLGNFFFLCEIAPSEIYKWFMELFIDAYDWVMVPNVYGMSQYADGGMMTTKPYFSSSNYILKMSNYPKGKWCEIWDALFWRFMIKHIKFFETQPRLSILCKKARTKKNEYALLTIAENFLKELQ